MHHEYSGPSGLLFQTAGILELWLYEKLLVSPINTLGITIIGNLGKMVNFQQYIILFNNIKSQLGIIGHVEEPMDREV